ncbi:MAG: peptidase M64 [Ignavibacteriales bacterium]|nr:peptidase M64 [Ignavibacteriales bacterium]
MKLFLLLAVVASAAFGQSENSYDDLFEDASLRIDYAHAGDARSEAFYLEALKREPYWGGSKKRLVEPFDYGKQRVELRLAETDSLLFAKNYSTLFSEWRTTAEAKQIPESYPEAVTTPFPKVPVRVVFYSRDTTRQFQERLSFFLEPDHMFISDEMNVVAPSFEAHKSGDPAVKADIVIVPEGYAADEMETFKADAIKFAGVLFRCSPFKERRDDFNVWGVLAPSEESGVDNPGKGEWRNTLMNASYHTFGMERYLMTRDYQAVRDVAANAPYDFIYILANSKKYGGGSIYGFYSMCVRENVAEEYIFVHEFGHGFAFLADEYYDSHTTYEDFYPPGREPLEPNITTLVDFDSKWASMVSEGTPIPTPPTEEWIDSVGAFEGGGYVARGVFRPTYDCTMKSTTFDNFCPVCRRAIETMIDYYAEE